MDPYIKPSLMNHDLTDEIQSETSPYTRIFVLMKLTDIIRNSQRSEVKASYKPQDPLNSQRGGPEVCPGVSDR